MFKKLFARSSTTPPAKQAATQPDASPAEQALLREIAARSKADPLIGAKIGSKEVTQWLIGAMKTERGVHIESIFCALGSLAGYACQAAIRAQAVAQGLEETALLVKVQTTDGNTYFFGDPLNKLVAESQYSVWGICGGGAQQAGCANLSNLTEIFEHTSSVLGTEAFGTLRVPEQHIPHEPPLNYVRALWPALQPLIVKFAQNPEHWPVLLSLSVQEVMAMGKSVLDPCIALSLVMQSAIPMSKVNLSQS